MTFVWLNADHLLNTELIEHVDLNYFHPMSRERCIRIEIRSAIAFAKDRVILLRYTPDLAAAIIDALNSCTEPHLPPVFFVSLMQRGWMEPIHNYAVNRVPCIGEHLILWDPQQWTPLTFQVEGIRHDIETLVGAPMQNIPPRPLTTLLIAPCHLSW